jgi:membrane-associated phospholipid phosphatase
MAAAAAAPSRAHDNLHAYTAAVPEPRPASLRLPHSVLVVAGVSFAILTLAALLAGTAGADTVIRNTLLLAGSPSIVSVMRVVNAAGDWKFLLPATLLLFAVFDHARRTWWVWIALMVAAPIAEGLMKIAVGRSRPGGLAYGFPSGHATAAAAYFGAWLYLAESLRPGWRATVRLVAVVLMLAVGVARVILRAHWPSDVLGGLALGLALASAAAVLAARRAA